MIGKFKRELPTDKELDQIAIHEAGHAVCSVIYGLPVWRVEILPNRLRDIWHRAVHDRDIDGVCLPIRRGSLRIPNDKLGEYARVCCAGYTAERLFYESVNRGGSEPDFDTATRLLVKLGKGAWMIPLICGEMMAVLGRHRDAVRAVADELLICKRLTGARVKEIIKESR